MRKRKELYPGTGDAEREKDRAARRGYSPDGVPDMIGVKPNYNKYPAWTPEKVLAWNNID